MTTPNSAASAAKRSVVGPGIGSARSNSAVSSRWQKYWVRKSSGRQMTCAPRCAASRTCATARSRLSSGSGEQRICTKPTVNFPLAKAFLRYVAYQRRVPLLTEGIAHHRDTEAQRKLLELNPLCLSVSVMKIPLANDRPASAPIRGSGSNSFNRKPLSEWYAVSSGAGPVGAPTAMPSTLPKRVDDRTVLSREAIREAETIFHTHLKRVGLKHTGQRDVILRTFLETRDHLSTDELYRLVKKKDERIGFTTVYRTLKLLRRVRPGERGRFPRWRGALRAPVQPPQPSSHGLHRLRQLGGVLFAGDRAHGAGDRPQVSAT